MEIKNSLETRAKKQNECAYITENEGENFEKLREKFNISFSYQFQSFTTRLGGWYKYVIVGIRNLFYFLNNK